jgi:hypothetical protein
MDVYWLAIAQQAYERVYPGTSWVIPWDSLSDSTKLFWVTVVKAVHNILVK